MKKVAWLLVIAIFITAVPVYAAENDGKGINKITFTDIESLMLERNPVIKTTENTLEELINSRNSIEDAEDDLDKAIDQLNAAIDAMNMAISNMDNSINALTGLIGQQMQLLPGNGEENGQHWQIGFGNSAGMPLDANVIISQAMLQSLISVRELYKSNVATLRENRNALRDQIERLPNQKLEIDKAILQLEMAKNSVIWGAQSLYFAYNSLERQKGDLLQNLKLLEDQLNIMELQKEMGMITDLDVRAVKLQKEQLERGIKLLENQIDGLKGELNLMLGQDFDAELVVGEIPELDGEELSQMNYEKDLDLAKRMNYSLRIQLCNYKIEGNNLEIAEDSGSSDERRTAERNFENATINYNQEQRKVELTFHKLYRNVLDKYDALKAEEKNLEYQRQRHDFLNLKYELGMASAMELNKSEVDYNAQLNKLESAKQDLLQAWTQYEWFIRGMSWEGTLP